MKLLIISPVIPYPLSEGGKIALYSMVDYLRHKCSITLLLFTYNETDIEYVNTLKYLWNNVDIDVLQANKSIIVKHYAGYKRFLNFLVKNIENVKFRINKLIEPANSVKKFEPVKPAEKLKYLISFAQAREPEIIDKIVKKIKTVQPDLVQLEFVEAMDLVLCIPKGIKKLLVHVEIRFRRVKTEINIVSEHIGSYGEYAQNLSELLELGLCEKFDGIITFSEDDKRHLSLKTQGKNIYSSPYAVLDKEILNIQNEDLMINKLVFVGFENHLPNKDAVEWYINEMSKNIYDKYGFVLHIIGNWSNEFKMHHANNKTIVFTGYVDDLSGYCKNSIMLVPLRIGSGIRTKILHSMAWGIPVITTSIGSEGIIDNDKIFLTANSPNEFIEAIDKITLDKELHKSMVANAQSVVKNYYSQKSAGDKRFSFYQSVLNDELINEHN